MRRTISLALALCLTLGGSGALVYLIFFADGWKGWMFAGAAFTAALGAMWLWADFIDATPNENVDA
jgi:hypothetical protein